MYFEVQTLYSKSTYTVPWWVGKIVEIFQWWYHFFSQILVAVGISMLYDSETWSTSPFVANPDPLLRGLRL